MEHEMNHESDPNSEVDIPVAQIDDEDDSALGEMLKSLLPTPHEVVRRTSVRALIQSSAKLSQPEAKLFDKTGTLPPSILLMRRTSSCAQPTSPPLLHETKGRKGKPKHVCTLCSQVFSRAHDLKRHNTIHETCKIDLHALQDITQS